MKAQARIGMLVMALAVAGVVAASAGLQEVQWKTISEALQEAPKGKKKIVLDIYTDWCSWCKKMDKNTYSEAGITSYLSEKYVASRMNPEKPGTIEYQGKSYSQAEFARVLGVSGYPATAFFNEDGELLTVLPGYMDPAAFRKVLTYFGDDIYKTTSWEDYQKAK